MEFSDNNNDQPFSGVDENEIAVGEPLLTGMFTFRKINDEGKIFDWEPHYFRLDESSLTHKETADDPITRGIIHLYDIVEVERYTGETPNPTTDRYVIRFMVRSKTTYIIILNSLATLNEWQRFMERKKGIMREEDINPPIAQPYRPQKSKYTLKTFFENRRMFGEMWLVYLYFAYTIMLVVLFSVLWTKYVLPLRGITQVPSDCLVLSKEAIYTYRHNYNLEFDVVYTVGNESVRGLVSQACGGKKCPDKLDDYPLDEYTPCFYDADDTDYVFFDLQPMVNRRYSIVFGICGGLFAPWLIFMVTMTITKFSTIKKILKNGCC